MHASHWHGSGVTGGFCMYCNTVINGKIKTPRLNTVNDKNKLLLCLWYKHSCNDAGSDNKVFYRKCNWVVSAFDVEYMLPEYTFSSAALKFESSLKSTFIDFV